MSGNTQMHPPDGKKRGGADAASLVGPPVMQVVAEKNIMTIDMYIY